ncbi:type II toxin-antitoxin system RelE/ParE family toxin [Paraburkholderia silviterrae]|uniref:Type II toxin-antitoxin system RelE/ParE family toxin n=1 Tax=Paraburkholderia silviterrae TaxID=2528715 RepID=A0A4R5MDB3_9BURK|nr:type II toxin-antitoxin system RelE/ParE family toxin [Paraburkholderia silviterrae]TDG24467.1 type II toxin-antitoxin system RelE/ParE family toxin [Paraburkholderia silviterrae]
MNFRVRYTRGARDDLERLYGFLLQRDVEAAARALEAIRKAADLLSSFPFTCRKVDDANPFLRELVISFGGSGYVALFEIEGEPAGEAASADQVNRYITILAVRHQREDDYH